MNSPRFKFQMLGTDGRVVGLFRSKGEVTENHLVLGKESLDLATITGTGIFNDRVIVHQGKLPELPYPISHGFQLKSAKQAQLVKRAIDVRASRFVSVARFRELERASKSSLFRTEMCPHCDATIDLSGMDKTPQVYCHWCDTISTKIGAVKEEASYRCCASCGLYSQPKLFTIFYSFGHVHTHRYVVRCNPCMRPDGWKMLFGNLIGILGIPVAITQLVRAYFGGSRFSKTFRELDDGNAAARRGDLARAEAAYAAILGRNQTLAGVLYNLALLHQGKNAQKSAIAARAALRACSNYTPAAQVLEGATRVLAESSASIASGRQPNAAA